MVFSHLVFISVFLPVVFLLYQWMPGIRWKNILLLAASLLFYAYGEPVYVFLMIASAFFHYLCAKGIEKSVAYRKVILAAVIIVNLGLLCVFKYAAFLVGLWNQGTGLVVPVPAVALPVGISFFTFQAMSYVMDVYFGETAAQKRFSHILLYISLFPQLIAGPIVKYHDIEQEITERRANAQDVAEGIRRFIVGLGKKTLLANYMAVIADTLFAAPIGQIHVLSAWLGAISYLFQIYFDFSGYSDMAIGLGRMFGFHFKENFRYPYAADSIQDFWRRWHISLSGWFREYLYIPLGGNRLGKRRTVINKFIVFACTGIWHGANVTFLFWGLFHGFFLMIEEYLPFFQRKASGWRSVARHVYVLFVVLIGFVFFRADTMTHGVCWILKMFAGWSFGAAEMRLLLSLLTPVHLTALLAAALGSVPPRLTEKTPWVKKASYPLTLLLLVLCMMNLAGGTYNPFIYFRF